MVYWPPINDILNAYPWYNTHFRGDPGFQVRGAHLKKMRRAEGGAKIFGVFRVKNHDFTPKNHIFSILGGVREIFGVFHVKITILRQKNHIFSNFRGGARRVHPPLNPPLHLPIVFRHHYPWYFDHLPMIYRPPYPWYFDPPINGILTPLPIHATLTPLPMVYRPLTIVFWPPIHGIKTHLPMVFWPRTNGIWSPLPMVYRHS
jgi:hypothetical protein